MSNAIATIFWVRGHLDSRAVHPLCRSEAGQAKYRSAPKKRVTQEHLRTTRHAQD